MPELRKTRCCCRCPIFFQPAICLYAVLCEIVSPSFSDLPITHIDPVGSCSARFITEVFFSAEQPVQQHWLFLFSYLLIFTHLVEMLRVYFGGGGLIWVCILFKLCTGMGLQRTSDAEVFNIYCLWQCSTLKQTQMSPQSKDQFTMFSRSMWKRKPIRMFNVFVL